MTLLKQIKISELAVFALALGVKSFESESSKKYDEIVGKDKHEGPWRILSRLKKLIQQKTFNPCKWKPTISTKF